MSQVRFDAMVKAAQAEGLLPAAMEPLHTDHRPWPVVMLTALGAWLAIVPLFISIFFLLADSLRHSTPAGLMGLILMGFSIAVLRARSLAPFIEQLAVPVLLTGLMLLGWVLFQTLGTELGIAVLCLLLLAVAAVIEQTWLRALLGAAAAVMCGYLMMGKMGRYFVLRHSLFLTPWLALHILTLIGLGTVWLSLKRFPSGAQARWGAMAESMLAGWLVATLTGLAYWSGMTFLLGGSLAPGSTFGMMDPASAELSQPWLDQAVSAILGLVGGLWLITRMPSLRQAWFIGVLLVLSALCALMPTLGACLFVLALCLGTRRWLLATSAALAAVWMVGAFYYALSLPLAIKGLSLMVAAAVLAVLALWGLRSLSNTAGDPNQVPSSGLETALARKANWGIALSLVLILLSANFSIWQKEQLIGHGRAVFVPLVPVDPRSLMQGDYMALNFLPRFGANVANSMDQEAFSFEHQRMMFKLDAQGIASVQGPDRGQPLAQDEVAMEMVLKNGRWILVTDAFYFKEGEGERWALARFGEFRVDAKGKALLVGLRGEGLKPL
jgi:uncharacterized membrane-anchored protein